jgi:hypothetical protein
VSLDKMTSLSAKNESSSLDIIVIKVLNSSKMTNNNNFFFWGGRGCNFLECLYSVKCHLCKKSSPYEHVTSLNARNESSSLDIIVIKVLNSSKMTIFFTTTIIFFGREGMQFFGVPVKCHLCKKS